MGVVTSQGLRRPCQEGIEGLPYISLLRSRCQSTPTNDNDFRRFSSKWVTCPCIMEGSQYAKIITLMFCALKAFRRSASCRAMLLSGWAVEGRSFCPERHGLAPPTSCRESDWLPFLSQVATMRLSSLAWLACAVVVLCACVVVHAQRSNLL